MSNMVTRCPQCQTSFKVTEEHLKIANGAVRCGSCLHVFQARQHWVNPDQPAPATPARSAFSQVDIPPPVQATTAATASQPAAVAPAAGKFSFDQAAIDSSSASNMLAEPDKRIPETALTKAHQHQPAKKIEEIGADDRISDDMGLEDDEPDELPAKPASIFSNNGFGEPDDDYSSLFDSADTAPDSDDFDALLSGDFNDLDELGSSNAPDESGTGVADDSWAQEMLEELQHEDEPEPVDLSQVEDVRDILTDFTNPVDVDAARRDLGIDSSPFASRELGTSKPAPAAPRAELIAHIEPPPVELLANHRPHQAGEWKTALFWYGTALALGLLLAIQYTFFNFDKLAKTASTRPYMEALCSTLRCQLPVMEAWRTVKISNLVVRKHPKVDNALAIDAILLNVAGRDMPFPRLEMYFSKDDKLPLASRRFEPAEYLSGEMAGKTTIPPGQPVHIALEIISPGPEAVNWSMQVTNLSE